VSVRVVAAACAVAVSCGGVALAADTGTYEGWLYKSSGERWKGSFTSLSVTETVRGQRFRLSAYNMRLGCPYLDRKGRQVRKRFRFIHRGVVSGNRIDDTRQYPKRNPTYEVRIRGRFVGRRFVGRVRVDAAPGRTGVCTGSARVRVSR
jgi:hypothetical protein